MTTEDTPPVDQKRCKKCGEVCEAGKRCRPCKAAGEKARRLANPEEYKARSRAYYVANAQKVNARAMAWAIANPEKAGAIKLAWAAANPGRRNELSRQWTAANREKRREIDARWYWANKEQKAERQKARRAANRERINAAQRARRAVNPEKTRAWTKKWQAANPEKVRANSRKQLLRRYGLTLAQYEALLAAQGGACAICRSLTPGKRSWHIDHDHECCPGTMHSCGRCVRGLLCHNCNLMLGHAGDSAELLLSAVEYVKSARGLRLVKGGKP